MGDTGVDIRRLTSFAGALRGGEFVGQLAQIPRVLDLLPGREGREVFEPPGRCRCRGAPAVVRVQSPPRRCSGANARVHCRRSSCRP
jgi:hypothetical protein